MSGDEGPASSVCLRCATKIEATDRFCRRCGNPLAPEIKASAPASKLVKGLTVGAITIIVITVIGGLVQRPLPDSPADLDANGSEKSAKLESRPKSPKPLATKKFVVGLLKTRTNSLQEAKDPQHACGKAGWDLSAPCIVTDVTEALANRGAAISETERLHREISTDQVSGYAVLGPASKGGIRLVTVTKNNTSGYTACLRAGWSPEDCKFFDLKVTGFAIHTLALLRKSIGRDGDIRTGQAKSDTDSSLSASLSSSPKKDLRLMLI